MEFRNVYFIGIGGIGMSAIARYFLHEGYAVAGYDRTPTPLTAKLQSEGAEIHYTDDPQLIPAAFSDPADTLVVFTPAIPADHREMAWMRSRGYKIEKRSEMLGYLTAGKYVMAVAGTHGKTTVTTMTAWFNHIAAADGPAGPGGGSAFLGGISRNFDSNMVLGQGRRIAVEADEFDRSFLRLAPDAAVITSTDADHLDIYGNHEALLDAFADFADRIKPGGSLILKKGIRISHLREDITVYRYSFDEECDFYARNIHLEDGGRYRFDIVCPDRTIEECTLGVPGWINIENAIAATALLWCAGFDAGRLKTALASFEGVKRRFEFYINTPRCVYMDDYAHHPRELTASIGSMKKMFPGRKLTAVFQPHLYTRTRDFYRGFAEALSLADNVLLVPIYPAREEPIEGVSSEMIGRLLSVPYTIVDKQNIAETLADMDTDLVATFGAGDIDAHCAEIAETLRKKYDLKI